VCPNWCRSILKPPKASAKLSDPADPARITSELLDWIKLLVAEDVPPEALRSKDKKSFLPPMFGALLKNEQDVGLVGGLGRGHGSLYN
jgi:hypothetical protein